MWVQDLQDECHQLRGIVGETESVLNLVMKKHRTHVEQLGVAVADERDRAAAEREASTHRVQALEREVVMLTGTVSKMASVMSLAVVADDDAVARQTTEITRLRTENAHLRQLLDIADIELDDGAMPVVPTGDVRQGAPA